MEMFRHISTIIYITSCLWWKSDVLN